MSDIHPKLASILEKACASLSPRQRYARDVIMGRQAWSGADLKGKARRNGASYYRQRQRALAALKAAGGCTIRTMPHGRIVTACHIADEGFGFTVFYAAVDGRGYAMFLGTDRAYPMEPAKD